jgi:protein phosphatase
MKSDRFDDARETTFHSDVRITCWGGTDTGQVRESNQDQFLIADLRKQMRIESSSVNFDPPHLTGQPMGKLLMVADGMGGMNAGEIASELATRATAEFLLNSVHWPFHPTPPEIDNFIEDLKDAACFSHTLIRDDSDVVPDHKGMGTTLTLAWLVWPLLYVLHVGDSRCYLSRQGHLQRVTRDQTLAQHLLDRGDLNEEQMRDSPFQHVLMSAIGAEDQPEAVVYRHRLQPGDRLLLCTDGVNNQLADDEIGRILACDGALPAIGQGLIDLANERGGEDNITVVLAAFDQRLSPP